MKTFHYTIIASKQESRLHPLTAGMEHSLRSCRLIGWLEAKSYENAGRLIEEIAQAAYPTEQGWELQLHWLPKR